MNKRQRKKQSRIPTVYELNFDTMSNWDTVTIDLRVTKNISFIDTDGMHYKVNMKEFRETLNKAKGGVV